MYILERKSGSVQLFLFFLTYLFSHFVMILLYFPPGHIGIFLSFFKKKKFCPLKFSTNPHVHDGLFSCETLSSFKKKNNNKANRSSEKV